MEEFWILILVLFATNSIDKAESVQLEELPLQTFDELFVEEWWDKDEAEDLITPAPTNFGQNEPNSTDQNPPLTESDHSGQIEPNSIDQNPPLTESDHFGQIEPKSTDQNPPLTESDHSGQIEPNSTDQNPPLTESEQKRKIIDKFHAIKDEFKQKGNYSSKEWVQIYNKIAKHLKVSHKKIYRWKKEFGLNQRKPKNDRKNLIEKFDQRKAELKRAGIKNSYHNEINETVAKELGLSFMTIYRWKRKLGQTVEYPHIKQKEMVKRYYEIKNQNSKISDEKIAAMFNIGISTLYRWKKQFKDTP